MTNPLGRADFEVIAGWVQRGESVLDLGCGDGSLLKLLIEAPGARGYGVEIEDANVRAAIRNGVNVHQGGLAAGGVAEGELGGVGCRRDEHVDCGAIVLDPGEERVLAEESVLAGDIKAPARVLV